MKSIFLFLFLSLFIIPVAYSGGGGEYYPEQQQQRMIPPLPTPPSNPFSQTEVIIAIIGLVGSLGGAYIAHRRSKS